MVRLPGKNLARAGNLLLQIPWELMNCSLALQGRMGHPGKRRRGRWEAGLVVIVVIVYLYSYWCWIKPWLGLLCQEIPDNPVPGPGSSGKLPMSIPERTDRQRQLRHGHTSSQASSPWDQETSAAPSDPQSSPTQRWEPGRNERGEIGRSSFSSGRRSYLMRISPS